MTISEDDPRQPFEQVAAVLRREIEQASIAPGQKVGSVRELAARFRVSPTTVQRALRVLRDEGLLMTTGRGTFARDPKQVGQVPDDVDSVDLSEVLRQLRHVTSQVSDLRSRVERLEAELADPAAETK
ncbi:MULTISPECIES: winged helix-turn-helix domain-containing protein [Streptomyces]|uniref:Winged helix-turn-helix transcriptional regulator n=1 Tax=Streptomyces griseocarneus TaxID=51201 RepID=A0ABX7RQW1_9ACTN|nr:MULTISPECIES: winged helix-turn-helix domain-containing protein [Streptomyces]QSY50197.1 winged helix-turn-helix transcriptional regulator [Streptomyces griseocarneus]